MITKLRSAGSHRYGPENQRSKLRLRRFLRCIPGSISRWIRTGTPSELLHLRTGQHELIVLGGCNQGDQGDWPERWEDEGQDTESNCVSFMRPSRPTDARTASGPRNKSVAQTKTSECIRIFWRSSQYGWIVCSCIAILCTGQYKRVSWKISTGESPASGNKSSSFTPSRTNPWLDPWGSERHRVSP